jgi:hypothetical protein
LTTEAPSPESVFASYGGILYAGELVRSPAWRAGYGDPLDGDAYFRVVFLEGPADFSAIVLHDSRIAVYLPGPRSAGHAQAEAALRALREAQSTYSTGADPLDALAGESARIEEQVVEEWTASFKAGWLITNPPLDVDLDEVFVDGYWTAWAARIGVALLARAYPEPPFLQALLRLPLRPDQDAPVLLAAVLRGSDGAAGFAMDAFAPALGLAPALAPRMVNLDRCTLIDDIASLVDQGRSPAEIGHDLAHERGLPYPLATLFLLLTIHRESYEIALRADHRILFRGAQTRPGSHIGSGDIAGLAWPQTIWADASTIGPASAEGMDASMANVGPDGSETIERLREGLTDITGALASLRSAQGNPAGENSAEALGQLAQAVVTENAAQLSEFSGLIFDTPAAFDDAMRLWQGWLDSMPHVAALVDGIDYMQRASLGDDDANLAFARNTLTKRLKDATLTCSPHIWPVLAGELVAFRRRYATVYIQHHDEYHAEVGRLGHQMEEIALRADALTRLNTLPELGPAAGASLSALVEELGNKVRACESELTIDGLIANPVCEACVLRLGQAPPTQSVGDLSKYVDGALGGRSRQLATQVAHRLAGRSDHPLIDRFVGVVQVSDLSGLANVLDDGLTQFIRDLLREAPTGGHADG